MIKNNRTTKRSKTYKMFDYVDGNFINIYSDDNPILSIGEHTYFLFNSITDAHIPLIGYGQIVKDTFIKGMDKNYHIKLLKIHNIPAVQKKYIFNSNKPFTICGYNEDVKGESIIKFNSNILAKQPIFNIHCLFARKDLNSITKLMTEYKDVILENLSKQYNELEEL